MTENLYQIVYRSHAKENFDPAEINSILAASQKNNSAQNITGMLFYKGKNFLQILEGAKEDLEALYKKILKDPRHEKAIVYWEGYIEERSFPTWSMTFKNLSDLNSDSVRQHKDIINQVFAVDEQAASLGYKLLMKYKEIFRDKL